jgi:superfamily II DNA helicase RecQ
MASSTPTTTPHASYTPAQLPHPTPPTATDRISQVLLRTWSERVVAASLDVWSMYPTDMQIQAVTSLINVDVCGGKLLLVVKTGAGKSHIMQLTGVMLGGVCLIIMPLLALGSDQVAKLRSASQEYGVVKYYHLDEHRDHPGSMSEILTELDALSQDTTSTTFIFVSPQLLRNNHSVRNCILLKLILNRF